MGSISDGLRAYWASAQAAGRRAKDEKDRIAARPGQAITAAKSRVSDTAAKALGAVQRSRISVSKAIEDKKSDFEQAKRDVGAKVRRATDEAKDVRSVIKHEIMGKPDAKDASRERTRNISMSDQSLRRRTAEGRAQTESQNENQRLASKERSAAADRDAARRRRETMHDSPNSEKGANDRKIDRMRLQSNSKNTEKVSKTGASIRARK